MLKRAMTDELIRRHDDRRKRQCPGEQEEHPRRETEVRNDLPSPGFFEPSLDAEVAREQQKDTRANSEF